MQCNAIINTDRSSLLTGNIKLIPVPLMELSSFRRIFFSTQTTQSLWVSTTNFATVQELEPSIVDLMIAHVFGTSLCACMRHSVSPTPYLPAVSFDRFFDSSESESAPAFPFPFPSAFLFGFFWGSSSS